MCACCMCVHMACFSVSTLCFEDYPGGWVYLQGVLFHCSRELHYATHTYTVYLPPTYGCPVSRFYLICFTFCFFECNASNIFCWIELHEIGICINQNGTDLEISCDPTKFLSFGVYLQDYIGGIYRGVSEMPVHRVCASSTLKLILNRVT